MTRGSVCLKITVHVFTTVKHFATQPQIPRHEYRSAIPPTTLGFLLFPGFPMACLTSAIEPLRAANEIIGRKEFAWRLIGEDACPVRSSAEVRFDPDMALGEAEGLDYLFFLSAPTSRFENPKHSNAQVRWLDRSGVILGGFSGGIFPLARVGRDAGPCAPRCIGAMRRRSMPSFRRWRPVRR